MKDRQQPGRKAALVGCSDCSHLWVVDDVRALGTIKCPRCGKTHRSRRALAESDDPEELAETRAQTLAKRAGELTEYQKNGTYWEQKTPAENTLTGYYDAYGETVRTQLVEHRERFSGLVEASRKNHRERFSALVSDTPAGRDRFAALADEVAGQVGSLAEQLSAYYGDRDPEPAPELPDAPEQIDPPTSRGDGSKSPGLTPTDQEPASTAATVTLDTTITDVWPALLSNPGVREAFVRSVRSLGEGETLPDVYGDLEARGVPIWIRSRIRDVCLGNRRETWRLLADVLPKIGKARGSTVADIHATASLFEHCDTVPTIGVTVPEEFKQLRPEQRQDLCQLVAVLSRGFDVRLVTTGLTRRWLAENHRDDLPGVSEWCNSGRDTTPVYSVREAAADELDPDSREVRILRLLNDEPTETLAYSEVYAEFQVEQSRIRQCLSQLSGLDLVEPFGPMSARKVELLEAGRKLLELFDEETARRDRDSGRVSETPKTHSQCRVSPATGRGGTAGPFRTVWLDRPTKEAAAACTADSDVTTVAAPVEHDELADDRRARAVAYENKQAVVSIYAGDALPYIVSLATALASPRFLDEALPPSTIEQIDEPDAIIRNGRCIGGYSAEAAADAGHFKTKLVQWGEDIEAMTTAMKRREYDDRDEFRSEIMKSAHGLAGSIVQLLDAAGIDLARDIRIPGGLADNVLEEIAKTVAHSAAIQSQYKSRSTYRQLFEQRPNKRQSALTVDVDSTDPEGDLIGGFVFRSTDVHRLRPYLEESLQSPAELFEDAPEFQVNLSVRAADRREFAAVAARILGRKRISLTREAVSLLTALVGSPFDAARALQQLGSEDRKRDVRPGEIRFALSTLPASSLLPELPPTVGKIVAALLRATETITQRELADRAGISPQSVRNHRDRLEALGLLAVDGQDIRLAVSFQEKDERRNPVVPELVETDAGFTDAVSRLLERILPPERYGDPDDPLGGVLFWPPDPWSLLDESDLSGWATVAVNLTATDRVDLEADVTLGPTVAQQSLTSSVEPRASAD